ncbi:MAG: phosphoribosyltransferase family protein [Polaribacter sp.]|nr:phosphoribosyltransferase family protein [Polaribacter sp.]
MITEENIILNTIQINQKIKRIAFQIYESNCNEDEVIIAGIIGNGYIFSQKLVAILKEISDLKITICKVNIDKKNPLNKITTSLEINGYRNKSLVLVDDVLNSGTTLIYGVKHFLDAPLNQFKTAVLVNRNHKKYPVKADFKGVSLSTSIKEHIQVDFKEEESVAYLI